MHNLVGRTDRYEQGRLNLNEKRLWGTPGADYLHLDAQDAYESQIDGYFDPAEHADFELEEWSVYETRETFPRAEDAREMFAEWLAERAHDGHGGEDYYDDVYEAANRQDLDAKFEELLAAAAEQVTYLCAKELIATHKGTFVRRDDGGWDVLLDGEKFYDHPAAS